MYFELSDFNGAEEYFSANGRQLWAEIDEIVHQQPIQLQPSDEKGKTGAPIFDPKATNASLTAAALEKAWKKVPVPAFLKPFGVDWDAGKSEVLVEWQFSNYPFLWNNIIRSEAVFSSRHTLPYMNPVKALIIVTKSGSFPASNSTLYYEQARAQTDTVTNLGVFDIPIRLVGLMIEPNATAVEAKWNVYPNRYARAVTQSSERTFSVRWSRPGQYGNRTAIFT